MMNWKDPLSKESLLYGKLTDLLQDLRSNSLYRIKDACDTLHNNKFINDCDVKNILDTCDEYQAAAEEYLNITDEEEEEEYVKSNGKEHPTQVNLTIKCNIHTNVVKDITCSMLIRMEYAEYIDTQKTIEKLGIKEIIKKKRS